MPYSAGTAFLQVVPSFENIQAEFEREAEKLGRKVDRAISKSVPEGMRHAAEQASREGQKAGDLYGNAFSDRMRRHIETALKSTPKIKVDADTSRADLAIFEMRQSLELLRDKKIGVGFSDADFFAEVAQIKALAEALEKRGINIEVRANARAVKAELESILKVQAEDAALRVQGQKAGDRFGDAFGAAVHRRLTAAFKALPEVDVNVNPHSAEAELGHIRRQLEELSNKEIDVDIPAAQYLDDLTTLEAALQALEQNDVSIKVKTNARAALAEIQALRQFTEGDSSRGQGTQDGTEFGGAFTTAARKAIKAGLAKLPEVEIDANSAPADREIARLRAELSTLVARIGVDVDADQAITEINAIEAQLRQLGRSDPRIEVRHNLLATAIELRAVQAEVDSLNRKAIDLEPKSSLAQLRAMADAADFSTSRIGVLVSVGLTLGTAIAPAAAAAAVAISGIATAASAAVIGVGVLGLGLFGPIKAIAALDKFQQDSAKSAVSMSGAEDRVANALDSVNGAERSLVRAQRDRLQAVKDLTRAQEDAQRQLEDMALSLKSNSLAQRQARLDEAEAKRELDKVLANPRATEEEREQARITFEQRTLQLEELGVKQKRLAADKAAADKKGVAGSDQVLAAQERILNATESVTSAQVSLAQSQRSLAAAYDKTGVAGGAAMQNLQQAMDALSPAGQRFANFIFSLKGNVKGLQAAAEGGLLPGLEQAIRNLLPALPQVERLVGSVAHGLGDSFVNLSVQLQNPAWRRFFGYIADTAVPALQGMFKFVTNIAQGVGSLVVALSPFNRGMGKGLIDLSEGFARWAENLDKSAGFQKFLGYVDRVGPKVVDLLEQLAIFVVRLVIAAAPIGEKVVTWFGWLFDLINGIPIGALTAFVAVLAVVATTLLIASAATAAWAKILVVIDVAAKIYTITTRLLNLVLGTHIGVTGQAAAKTNTFAQALEQQTGSASKAKGGLSNLISVLGGPWGIALAAATIALITFEAAQNRVRDSAQRMGDAMTSIGSAFKDGGDSAVIALARQDKAVAEAIIQLRRYGVTAQDVFSASEGDVKAQAKVLDGLRAQLHAMNQELETFKAAQRNVPAFQQDQGEVNRRQEAIDALNNVIKDQEERYRLAAAAAAAYGRSTDELADQSKRATLATSIYGQKISDLEQVYAALTSKTTDASSAAQAFRRFTDDATKSAVGATEAEEARVRALLDLKQALKENGGELDLNTAKTDEQKRAVLANRDALEDALRAAREKTLADIEAKVGLEEATKANEDRINAILQEIPATQRNSAVVQELVTRYGQIPAEISTKIRTDGAEAVLQQLNDLKTAQYALEKNLTIPAAKSALAGQLSQFESQVPRQGRAGGGYITGPGGPTEDRIPAWLSNGEYVIPAAVVDMLGVGFFDTLIAKKMFAADSPASNPMYARGGIVAPYKVDVSKTKMPYTMAELQAKYGNQGGGPVGAGPGFLPWPSSPGAQRGDSGVWRSILDLVRQSAIPYTFGNSYRAGDPLWHGSGRAIDFMGFNQNRLAQFFMDMRPRVLELIHSTNSGGYYITRGVRKSSMGDQDALHYNHLHIAMDQGGMLQPGWNPPIWNGTGKPEPVLNGHQWDSISALARGGDGAGANYNFTFRDTTLTPGKLRALQDREAALNRDGRAR